MTSKGHHPTPKERDEPLSLYGLKPDDVAKAILATEVDPVTEAPKRQRRRKT